MSSRPPHQASGTVDQLSKEGQPIVHSWPRLSNSEGLALNEGTLYLAGEAAVGQEQHAVRRRGAREGAPWPLDSGIVLTAVAQDLTRLKG